ncbi:MAG: HlyD family efflux transporter periplasmic adaptor subunit [Planctomycetaceae bacterium]|nr:HlyD family efflux transporter periplasmic adaptor subunit [Planctomycetaceae bacterium]
MNRWSIKILLLGLVALVLLGLLLKDQWSSKPLVVSGIIEADEVRLGSRVGGRVLKVHVEEGEEISAGTPLVELEPFDLNQRRAEAVAHQDELDARHRKLKEGFRDEEVAAAAARMEQAQAELDKLINGPREEEIESAKAKLSVATNSLSLQQKEYERAKRLFQKETITRDEFDQAETEFEIAKDEVRYRDEQLKLLQSGTRPEEIAAGKAQLKAATEEWKKLKAGTRQEEIDEAYFALEAAKQRVAVIDQQIAELKVESRFSGIVQAIDLEPGDLINANAPVLSVLDTSDLWVRAYVPEDHLDLSVDQQVKITVDSYPEESFSGQISFIASEAEFTPRNVQTPEERSKQVFRIKVSIKDEENRLRPGMGADVWLKP